MRRLPFLRILGALCASALITKGNEVIEWNALMLDAIRLDNSGPTVSARNLAIMHTAIYDAVNSITGTHQPYRAAEPASPDFPADAAAAGAADELIRVLYPVVAARAEEMLTAFLAGREGDGATLAALALGRTVARAALEARREDGSSTQVPYIPSEEPGAWRRTPPFFRPPLTPHWRHVELFAVPEVERFLPPPPPPLESEAYAAACHEVKALGGENSGVRTEEQTQIAIFWSDFSYTSMPPGHWHEIAADIARGQGLSLAESARLFALLAIAQADAAIVCWEAKFRHNLWRPVTAIERAGEDGNPLTQPDTEWKQLLPAPPFPAYPSGHSTFSQASAEVLKGFFGRDAISFTARSDSLPGVTRSFGSLDACAAEVGLSRIYGGIHFAFDDEAGKMSGKRIGQFVSANWLLPIETLPRIELEGIAEGEVRLRAHGKAGAAITVQASGNLKDWVDIGSATAQGGGVPVVDAAPPGKARFYRIFTAE